MRTVVSPTLVQDPGAHASPAVAIISNYSLGASSQATQRTLAASAIVQACSPLIEDLGGWLVFGWLSATQRSESPALMATEGFKARDIGARAQRKILSRMANKNVAKVFIDDTTGSLLDNVYKLAKSYSGDKKESEKLVKNIIKIVIKLGLLYRNKEFSKDELEAANRFKNKFHSTAMAVVSFYEVDFSYDCNFLVQAFGECHQGLRSIVVAHLTPKSLGRIDSVFGFFSEPAFLDAVFKKESPHREALGRVVKDINKALDEGGM